MTGLLLTAPPGQALAPLLLHFVLVMGLYVALTVARLAAVQRRQAAYGDFARADGDPPGSARIQRNLANQFEAPLFAWAAMLVLLWADAVLWFDVAAAWLFLGGRLVHTWVQTTGDDVRLRGRVFTINFVGVLALMGHAGWVVLERLG